MIISDLRSGRGPGTDPFLCTRNEAPTPALRFGAVYISTLGAPAPIYARVTHAVRSCGIS